MLVAKLDLAQYLVVRSVAEFLGSKIQGFFKHFRQRQGGDSGGVGAHSGDSARLNGAKPREEPGNGRMPNASGATLCHHIQLPSALSCVCPFLPVHVICKRAGTLCLLLMIASSDAVVKPSNAVCSTPNGCAQWCRHNT